MKPLHCIALFAVVAVLAAPTATSSAGDQRGVLLPLQNRTGDGAIAERAREVALEELAAWLEMADGTGMRDLLRRQRVRDAGTVSSVDLQRLGAEMDVDWVISLTLHRLTGGDCPQVVLSGWAQHIERAESRWFGFLGASGLDSRRSLGRGGDEDLDTLAQRGVRRLIGDLGDALEGRRQVAVNGRPSPDRYRAGNLDIGAIERIAVLPFESLADRDATIAGETITAMARAELDRRGIPQLPPGDVHAILARRGALLTGELDALSRMALKIGPGADHFLAGMVEHYKPSAGLEPEPRIAFSARLVEIESGEIVWIDGLDRLGWDDESWFERDRIHDPGSLAKMMMEDLIAGLLRPTHSAKRK